MSKFSFDPENTLTGLLGKLDPGEIIALGISLCHFVEDESPYSFRGGIWPGNISWDGTQAALGPYEAKGLKEMGPDALEYIAPEQFWNGDMSTASDVYSIGLVLFTALNGGVMPISRLSPATLPKSARRLCRSVCAAALWTTPAPPAVSLEI